MLFHAPQLILLFVHQTCFKFTLDFIKLSAADRFSLQDEKMMFAAHTRESRDKWIFTLNKCCSNDSLECKYCKFSSQILFKSS